MQSQDARAIAQGYARERAQLKIERQQKEKQLELAVLNKPVPEILPQKHIIIWTNTQGQEQRRYGSDQLSQLWANAGVGLSTVKRMINTGTAIKVFGGYMKIVPEQTE